MKPNKIIERLQNTDETYIPSNNTPDYVSQRINFQQNQQQPKNPSQQMWQGDPYQQQWNTPYPQPPYYNPNPNPQPFFNNYYIPEEPIYDEEPEDPNEYDYENEYEKQLKREERAFKRKKIKAIALICSAVFYGFSLIIGILNTTVINGNAQFITLEIANERAVYKEIKKGMDELNDYNTFQGISEIAEVKDMGNYQEKITIYSNTIKKLQNRKDEWADYFYKNGTDDVLNTEMVNMYTELLDEQISLLTYVNNYYRLCAGASPEDEAQIAEMEKNIQSKHGAYVNKLIGYSTRLEDISILLRL